MTAYTINVTQEDIDNGVRSACRSCPVALAMKRAFPLKDVKVHEYVTWVGLDRFAKLPAEAKDFIFNFDAEEPVEPFSFTINLEY